MVSQVEDGTALLRQVRLQRPDVAIVDIRMPPTHTDEGLVAATQIRAEHPETGVLLLSHYVEPSYALRLLEEHPERVGYLLKERVFDVAILIDALRRLVDGETVVDPDDRRAAPRPPAPRGSAGRAHPARAGGARARRRGPLQPRDRDAAVRHRAHGRGPHPADLPQAAAHADPESHRRVLAVVAYLSRAT